jgi:hypothetical protein
LRIFKHQYNTSDVKKISILERATTTQLGELKDQHIHTLGKLLKYEASPKNKHDTE